MRCLPDSMRAAMNLPPARAAGLMIAALALLAAGACDQSQAPKSMVASPAQASTTPTSKTQPASPPVDRLTGQQLRELFDAGEFERFTVAGCAAHPEAENDPDRLLWRVEALLAVGRAAEAELAAAAAAHSFETPVPADQALAERAIKLWTAARLRQGRQLEPALTQLIASSPQLGKIAQGLKTWRAEIGEREPYRVSGQAKSAELPLVEHTAWTGLVSHELEAIGIEVNDVRLPIVFIDTGAQHTLISTAAAAAAGLEVGEAQSELVGFATTQARPAVIKRLQLGRLTLLDVPVLVGDSAGLTIAKGQGALGIDLMHHVRFTIDYPAKQVVAETYPLHEPAAIESESVWDVPVWTFSQACLAQGKLTAGPFARVLIDTGNRVGTFVSPRWMRRSVPDFRRPQAPIVPWVKNRQFHIAPLELAGQTLADWPVFDTLPEELERLDLVDVLVGHDLLWQYQVTIDLRQRLFRLRNSRLPVPASESEP